MKESRQYEIQHCIYLVESNRKISKPYWSHWKYYDTKEGAEQALRDYRKKPFYGGTFNSTDKRNSIKCLWRYRVIKIKQQIF